MSDEVNTRALIEAAIQICGGTQAGLARKIGGRCRQGHVYKWLQQDRVSAEVAHSIDRATNGSVPKHQLRPDLFDAPQQAA